MVALIIVWHYTVGLIGEWLLSNDIKYKQLLFEPLTHFETKQTSVVLIDRIYMYTSWNADFKN